MNKKRSKTVVVETKGGLPHRPPGHKGKEVDARGNVYMDAPCTLCGQIYWCHELEDGDGSPIYLCVDYCLKSLKNQLEEEILDEYGKIGETQKLR